MLGTDALDGAVTLRSGDSSPTPSPALRRDDWEHARQAATTCSFATSATLVAHAAVVPRPIWIDGHEHSVGYVEAVATAVAFQGSGLRHGRDAGDRRDTRRSEPIGVLSTDAWHFYERLGWQRWRGPTAVRLGSGETVRTPDEDAGIMVRPQMTRLDLGDPIQCAERTGDDW